MLKIVEILMVLKTPKEPSRVVPVILGMRDSKASKIFRNPKNSRNFKVSARSRYFRDSRDYEDSGDSVGVG